MSILSPQSLPCSYTDIDGDCLRQAERGRSQCAAHRKAAQRATRRAERLQAPLASIAGDPHPSATPGPTAVLAPARPLVAAREPGAQEAEDARRADEMSPEWAALLNSRRPGRRGTRNYVQDAVRERERNALR